MAQSKKDAPKKDSVDDLTNTLLAGRRAEAQHIPSIMDVTPEQRQEIGLGLIRRSPYQGRLEFDPVYIAELADSVKAGGLVQPIVVRFIAPQTKADGDGWYELVAGENRLEAFKLLKRETIPAIVRVYTDAQAALALATENAQRKNLAPWEAYNQARILQAEGFAKTIEELGAVFGKKRTSIQQLLTFGDLPASVQAILAEKPALMGADLAEALKVEGWNKAHPELVLQAVQKLAAGGIKQSGVMGWLRQQTKPQSNGYLRQETFMVGRRKVHVTVYEDSVRISANGIGDTRIEEWLKKEAENLFK